MPAPSRNFRYTLLFLLAMAEVMPLALLSQAIPVLMRRNGASMQQIGVVFLAMFPWSFKAIWAPLVDRLGRNSSLGRYRSWLLITHPVLFGTLLLGSYIDIPTLLMHNRAAVFPGLIWLTSVCAVADAASHGMAVQLLAPHERGLGNGLQTAGLMLGNVVGGGFMVILAGSFGWQTAMFMVALFVLCTIPVIALYKEPPVEFVRVINPAEVLAFFQRPRMLRWLLIIAIFPIGGSLIGPAMDTMLVDRGFALKEIGLVLGVLSSCAGILGGMLGGLTVERLGRARSFYILTLFSALCLGLVLLNRVATGRALLYFVIALPNVGLLARGTMLHVLMMDRCRSHAASTDFTIQYTVQQVSRFGASSLGAVLAGVFGSTGVYVLAPLLTIGVLVLAAQLLERRDFQPTRLEPDPAVAALTEPPVYCEAAGN